jgi:hypothetical protein
MPAAPEPGWLELCTLEGGKSTHPPRGAKSIHPPGGALALSDRRCRGRSDGRRCLAGGSLAIEREFLDRLGRLLGRVRHRRVPDPADVTELRALGSAARSGGPGAEAARCQARPTGSAPGVEGGEPARLGVERVRQGGVEARVCSRTARSPPAAARDPFSTRAQLGPAASTRPAGWSRRNAGGGTFRATHRIPRRLATPQSCSRACWRPAGEIAVTVWARPRRAGSSANPAPERVAGDVRTGARARPRRCRRVPRAWSRPPPAASPSARIPAGRPRARRSAARAAAASAATRARCGRFRG